MSDKWEGRRIFWPITDMEGERRHDLGRCNGHSPSQLVQQLPEPDCHSRMEAVCSSETLTPNNVLTVSCLTTGTAGPVSQTEIQDVLLSHRTASEQTARTVCEEDGTSHGSVA